MEWRGGFISSPNPNRVHAIVPILKLMYQGEKFDEIKSKRISEIINVNITPKCAKCKLIKFLVVEYVCITCS